jgi:glycosyltransferase involved in cell wall biosynthesis
LTATGYRPKVSIVVPTLNEARNLPHIFQMLPQDAEVVVVDGRSTDGTESVAKALRPDAVVVNQTRKGKGNALASGFAAATGDIIVMLDADGSADPAEIEDFVQVLVDGADYAKGSRFIDGGGSSDITRLRAKGNLGLSMLTNLLLRHRFTDLCYGYNAFWSYCVPVLGLVPGERGGEPQWGDGFEVETLINIRAVRGDLKIVEVPSYEHPRLMGVTNLNALKDGLRVLRTIFAEVTRPMPERLRREAAAGRTRIQRRIADGEEARASAALPATTSVSTREAS